MKKIITLINKVIPSFLLPLCSCFFLFSFFFLLTSYSSSAQADMADLINERKTILKQVDDLSKNEKTFKNKKSIADFQAALKKLIEIDEQIILAANYSLENLKNQRDEALQRKKEVIKTPGTTTVVYAGNDSLLNVINQLQGQSGSMGNVLKVKDDALTALAFKSDSLQDANKRINTRFDAIEIDNKNIGEKNVILIIFNCLAVLALLVCLFFLVRRPVASKMLLNQEMVRQPALIVELPPTRQEMQQPEPEKPRPAPAPPQAKKAEQVIKVSSEGIMSSNNDSLDFKLEQLEKLARLREKGFLTDEEFALQKKQILGT